MSEIRFTRQNPWSCPSYKDYYIMDKYSGKDIYGHDAYDYALFRHCGFQLVRTFKTRKRAYQFIGKETGLSDWDLRMGSYAFICNDRELLGVQRDGILWRIEKRSRPVRVLTRPIEDERLTGWFTTYNECLQVSKEFIKQEELS